MGDKVYIILLNWNGWKDTIECLESVFRNLYLNYKVIVCDNDSDDGSLDKIKQWADGKLQAIISEDERIFKYTSPPVTKPILYQEYNREQGEKGGFLDREETPLILIQTGGNLGFAGGNNVGIRYALARGDFEYIWLLNNDTVIDNDALVYLVKRMQENLAVGICGSTLLYYHDPEKVQALGGATYNKWLGISSHMGCSLRLAEKVNEKEIENKLDYIVGASMLMSKKFVQDIGLLNEEYFLYFEEIDLAIRGKEKYSLAYARNSIVYHKEGASIGSSSDPVLKSYKSDYYGIKSKITFTQRYFKTAMPIIYVSLLVSIINRIKRRQWERVAMIVKLVFHGIRK